MTPLRLPSREFRRARQGAWVELEALLERAERKGIAALTANEVGRLPVLYRAAISSLSVARSVSLDASLLDYLECLSARAYACVYGTRQRFGSVLRDFFNRRFPEAVRALRLSIALAAAFLALGTVAGYAMVRHDPEAFYAIVPETHGDDRNPAASTETLRKTLYDPEYRSGRLAAFSSFLFSHNAQIGILAFALGFAAGLPVFFLMFWNGLSLGALAALFSERGLGLDFWAWVLPHGVSELSAVALCGGAGLAVAGSLVFPGRHGRLKSLAIRGREAALLVLGAISMLLLAAFIEGVIRQAFPFLILRLAIAIFTAGAWAAYFGLAGREARR